MTVSARVTTSYMTAKLHSDTVTVVDRNKADGISYSPGE